ncbi:hypothetical protein BJV82DRAFT_588256 [Fennellomyces sp. T-0311]|nr:hypothetical protein BJV82DRAFT_588256 [Fennellomyces sp. T-0311]
MHRIISLSIAAFMLSAVMVVKASPLPPVTYSVCAVDTTGNPPCAQQDVTVTGSKLQTQSSSGNNGTGAFSKRRAHDEPDEEEPDEEEADENDNEEDEDEEDEDEKDEH